MMISTSSLMLDGHHGHGLGHGPGLGASHHMTFVDPYLRGKLPGTVPEFMRPFPKPPPIVPRFAGQLPPASDSPRKDYANVPATPVSGSGPVNLSSVKMEGAGLPGEGHIPTTNIHVPPLTTNYNSRMFPPPGFPYSSLQNHYASMYSSSYSSSLLSRPLYMSSNPLSPLENQFNSSQKTKSGSNSPGLFLQPPGTYPNSGSGSPSGSLSTVVATSKSNQSSLRDNKRPFKVPTAKEANGRQKLLSTGRSSSKRLTLVSSSNSNINNNNNLLPPNFTKGSLIQLANGELRRVEDITTEELVSSADKCPAFRLDPSTVVRIQENSHGTVLLTLSYGENKRTIEMESTLEYPYFVYGQGWTSCSPERTLNCYGLQCSRLKVGDICLSLSPRQTQDAEDKVQSTGLS